jgi:hypothetical protein
MGPRTSLDTVEMSLREIRTPTSRLYRPKPVDVSNEIPRSPQSRKADVV